MPRTRTQTQTLAQRAQQPRRRIITSAIPQLSVTEVRRGLDLIRRRWADRHRSAFELSGQATGGLTVQAFALKFLLGHHAKRHARRGAKAEV